jgi:DtxR family Mn-dependent transcriptional regulator
MPSATLEEYLESIYKIALAGEVRPTQIADALSVSGPTVTVTLRRLEAAGLIERPNGGVSLTETGTREALAVIRRHRIAERFLVDVLDLPWEAAHEDACLLEHAMSPRVLEALERYLENPSVCPHGHPIPTVDGVVPELVGVPMSDLPAEAEGVVVRVTEDRDEMLSYIASLGLVPGVRVRIDEVAPFSGPFLVGVRGVVHPVARDVAERVFVEPDHRSR